jgi:hypothetical protein
MHRRDFMASSGNAAAAFVGLSASSDDPGQSDDCAAAPEGIVCAMRAYAGVDWNLVKWNKITHEGDYSDLRKRAIGLLEETNPAVWGELPEDYDGNVRQRGLKQRLRQLIGSTTEHKLRMFALFEKLPVSGLPQQEHMMAVFAYRWREAAGAKTVPQLKLVGLARKYLPPISAPEEYRLYLRGVGERLVAQLYEANTGLRGYTIDVKIPALNAHSTLAALAERIRARPRPMLGPAEMRLTEFIDPDDGTRTWEIPVPA